ncbi:MAG: hypothetical protein RLZZ234_551 [Candidatus Parcubacteria bacterium]|jgi:uncharacterized protein YpuA (DUF1002 family)
MATAKKQVKNTELTGGQKIGIGVGVTATMLAAVGGYFLYASKDAKKNRTKVGSWMLKAKAEVLEGIENTKELTEADYDKLVDDVMKGYKAARSASVKDLADFAGEMKNHWKKIKTAGPEKKVSIPVTAAKPAKKAVKKAAKK